MRVKYDILTMGCKVNTYDSSLLEKTLESAGFARDPQAPDVHIINGCAVTENSTLEAHRLVKKIKKQHPQSTVVVTGCVAQVDVERLRGLTGADLIIGNSHKPQLTKILSNYLSLQSQNEDLEVEASSTRQSPERVFHSNIFKKEDLEPGGGIEHSRTRAFLKIQDGCNSFCGFCIIPFARGRSRSLSIPHLVDRVHDLVVQGFKEVVLTGVHCGDYQSDGGENFSDLVEAILIKTEVERVRLSSLEPIEVDERLWSLFQAHPRLCPHIHVSLQSANTKVLREMKRKYSQENIKDFFQRFSNHVSGGFIGMDIIVGYPGETDDEFEDTVQFLVNQPQWARLHVFPYSRRPGTAAARRGDHLPLGTISHRAAQLRRLGRLRQTEKSLEQVGSTKKVLILEKESHGAHGISRDYWPVKIRDLDISHYVNQELTVEITGSCDPGSGQDRILEGVGVRLT